MPAVLKKGQTGLSCKLTNNDLNQQTLQELRTCKVVLISLTQ